MKAKKVRNALQARFEAVRLNNMILDCMIFGQGAIFQTEKTFRHIPINKMIKVKSF